MKYKSISILGTLLVFLTSCALFHQTPQVVGKASKNEDKAKAKIDFVDNTLSQINVQRLDSIGTFSTGVQYSLNKETNASSVVVIAKNLNERILALANKPDFKEAQEISLLVDTILTNKASGEKMLAQKDSEIESLISSVKDTELAKNDAVNAYIKLADKTAGEADSYQATISKMDSFFGLGAIFYGTKKLIISMSWALGIGGLIFIALRILSFSNPAAAAIFSIFSKMGGWLINTIEYIIPKAADEAGYVGKALYTDAQTALNEVITGVQTAEASGKPVSATAVINSVAASLSPTQQAQIASGSLTPASSAVLDTIASAAPVTSSVVLVSSIVPIVPITGSVVSGSSIITGNKT